MRQIREVSRASGLPLGRPNSMNKYGLVLNEVGMEPLFDSLQSRVLAPIKGGFPRTLQPPVALLLPLSEKKKSTP